MHQRIIPTLVIMRVCGLCRDTASSCPVVGIPIVLNRLLLNSASYHTNNLKYKYLP